MVVVRIVVVVVVVYIALVVEGCGGGKGRGGWMVSGWQFRLFLHSRICKVILHIAWPYMIQIQQGWVGDGRGSYYGNIWI